MDPSDRCAAFGISKYHGVGEEVCLCVWAGGGGKLVDFVKVSDPKHHWLSPPGVDLS